MQNRCQRVLLTMIVLLCAAGGLAGRALALTFTEFPIAAGSRPVGITTGPDGALWFTEPYLDQIGRITTKGTIREFKMPRGSTVPGSLGNITQGPDGALWFNDFTVNQIGRITTGGVITEFKIPTPGSFPIDITQGPDGALWFTENAANQIGRITTDGVITEFKIPTASSNPDGITTGPDGALWFTEFFSEKIDRITTDGMITEFPLSPGSGWPQKITTGPDGALWFTQLSSAATSQKIGRITTDGVITEFKHPSWKVAFAQAQPPTLIDIVPGSGPAGEAYPLEATIRGTGFLPTGNVVEFGPVKIPDQPSAGGVRITFSVPKLVPSRGEVPPMVLPEGDYRVTVTTPAGTSNGLMFRLTRSP